MKYTIKFLEKDVMETIENDIKKVALYHSDRDPIISADFFSIPRHVFCIIEFLGFLDSGDKINSTERAEKFIKDYFPYNYKEYAELLIKMWRHGTVHNFKPKSYCAKYKNETPNKITIRWLSNNSNYWINRRVNLEKFSMAGKDDTEIYMVLNNCQLVDDLLFALFTFISRIKEDPKKICGCEQRIKQAFSVSSLDEKINHNKRTNDLKTILSNQIKKAYLDKDGLIDENYQVVLRFKSK